MFGGVRLWCAVAVRLGGVLWCVVVCDRGVRSGCAVAVCADVRRYAALSPTSSSSFTTFFLQCEDCLA